MFARVRQACVRRASDSRELGHRVMKCHQMGIVQTHIVTETCGHGAFGSCIAARATYSGVARSLRGKSTGIERIGSLRGRALERRSRSATRIGRPYEPEYGR